jgi:hypothetical protein
VRSQLIFLLLESISVKAAIFVHYYLLVALFLKSILSNRRAHSKGTFLVLLESLTVKSAIFVYYFSLRPEPITSEHLA